MLATIGYERSILADFVATLRIKDVEVLIDIRDRAQSRRPGFSKSALAHALHDAGIEYIHLPQLGDPKEGREAARNGQFDRFREIFASVMASPSAQAALEQIESIATGRFVCLMCYERDQKTCHRKIVSDYLEGRLLCKTEHLGVKEGVSREAKVGRMRYSDKGATSQVVQIF